MKEEFSSDGSLLTRRLSVNGASGVSAVTPWDDIPDGSPPETLASIWDSSFLRNPVAYQQAESAARSVRIADIFCGAGGLSYGVHQAVKACGIRTESVLAVDVDPVAVEVYRRNFDPARFSTVNLWESVTTSYSTRKRPARFSGAPQLLTEKLKDVQGKVDILLGGPPCEGHSTSNNVTRMNDPRNKYYIVMPALAVALDAKVVIVENVPGVRHDFRHVLDNAKDLFETNGYQVDDTVVDAMALGLPQTRKRHILVACKTGSPDLKEIIALFERPQHDLRWAIGDLLNVDSSDLFDTGPELSDVNRRRIKYLFDNDEYNLPNEQRPDSHRNGHTYPSIYGRLRWDMPSGTITTGFNTPGRGRYIHPEIQRTITAHEAARIQGFPDAFEFRTIGGETPARSSLANMIGDAVPPRIGYIAGVAALAALDLETLPGQNV